MVKIDRIRSLDELDSLEDEWRRLERSAPGTSFFQSWQWNRTWCEHFLTKPGSGRLNLRVAVDSSGRVLAIFPLFEEDLAGGLARITQFLCHRMSYHNDILLPEHENEELVGDVTDALRNDLDWRTFLSLRHLDEKSEFLKFVAKSGKAQPQCTRLQVVADPSIVDQSTRLGKSTRKRYRRQVNKLNREHQSDFSIHRDDSIGPAFEALVDLHSRRFSAAGRETIFSGASLDFWLHALECTGDEASFEIVQLNASGKAIASGLGLHDGKHYFGIQTGFDPEFGEFSPMRILFAEIMRRAFVDLGCEIYDHGPGYEGYKHEWSPAVSTNFYYGQGGRGPYAKSVASAYEWAFLRSLPKMSQSK